MATLWVTLPTTVTRSTTLRLHSVGSWLLSERGRKQDSGIDGTVRVVFARSPYYSKNSGKHFTPCGQTSNGNSDGLPIMQEDWHRSLTGSADRHEFNNGFKQNC